MQFAYQAGTLSSLLLKFCGCQELCLYGNLVKEGIFFFFFPIILFLLYYYLYYIAQAFFFSFNFTILYWFCHVSTFFSYFISNLDSQDLESHVNWFPPSLSHFDICDPG